METKILIKKKNGKEENFSIKKVEKSLKKSGIDTALCKKICHGIEYKIKKNDSTDKIYHYVNKILKQNNDKKVLLRYSLPSAILKLGPEGFAFEQFIGEIFEAYGYSPVFVGKKIPGKCIRTHEMDIVAQKDNTMTTAELKFHNSKAKKTDLKVALYMKARFDDIEASGFYKELLPIKMIITNTKFTTNAKIYSNCVKIKVLS
jgi:hypothetical protein